MQMNRLMFSSQEAAQLIHKAIDYSRMNDFFVLCRIMKNVNLFNLAKVIGDSVDIIGKRPGEKLNEVLVTEKELPNTLVDGDYVLVFDHQIIDGNLQEEHSSLTAKTMDTHDMKELVYG